MLLRYRFALLSAVLALTLSLGACAPAEEAGAAPQAPVSDTDTTPNETPDADDSQAPAGIMSRFTATDLEGSEVDQSIFSDYKLTMVNVWATFCTPCINEMPDLGELVAEYSDQGVRIVGLVLDTLDSDGSISESQVETAKEIVTQTGADYLHLLPSPDLYHILSDITGVPTTFFVDSTGAQVGHAIVSAQSKEEWVETIDSMLAEVEA